MYQIAQDGYVSKAKDKGYDYPNWLVIFHFINIVFTVNLISKKGHFLKKDCPPKKETCGSTNLHTRDIWKH